MSNRDVFAFQRPLLTFARSTRERMLMVSFCAAAAILQSAWFDHGFSLLIAAGALSGALAVEGLFALKRGAASLRDGSSLVTALLLTLLLPNTLHPIYAAVGAAFAVSVVKYTFGGLGANWLNPALGGWLFIRFSYPKMFDRAMEGSPLTFISMWMTEPSGASGTSPVTILMKNGFGTHNGEALTSFLNKTLFSLFNIELPAAYLDFFVNPGTGIIADRGLLALLAASVIMMSAMVSRSLLSALYIAATLALVKIAGGLPFGGESGTGDMIFCLFSGGTLAAALFMVAEPATSLKTPFGRVCAVLIAALFTYVFRYLKAEAYGAVFAIVIMNILAPAGRMFEERFCYEGGVSWLQR